MKTEIEIIIPEGYRLSPESTDERIVLELVEKSVEDGAKEFLFNIFNKMKVRVDPNKSGRVYYEVDGEPVFIPDFENTILWVSYTHIWGVLETKYAMEYYEIKTLIKKTVEEVLNWKGLIPYFIQMFSDS